MDHWLENPTNVQYVERLRERLASDDTSIFVFLGAGLSYGVGRTRATFEDDWYDDDYRFPSWPQLVNRMRDDLLVDPVISQHGESLKQFFEDQGPLDCAQSFWNYRQGPNYWDFLRRQFESQPGDDDRLSPSHHELTELPIKTVFTTNYDELIETAYRTKGVLYRASSSPREFLNNLAAHQDIHIVKLHGTIQQPDTIVFTRSDYAKSRRERTQMFAHLVEQFQYATFLFVGFSLKDPNFNILFDEAHYVRQGQNPVSYVVQGRADPVYDSYLASMGVNTITLDFWEQLPQFLRAINPAIV